MRTPKTLFNCSKASFSISLAPYAGRLVVATTREEYCRIFDRWYSGNHKLDLEQPGECMDYIDSKGRFRVLIYSATMSALVHELGHIVSYVFKHCGVRHSLTNDEPFCYFLQHLFDEIVKRGKIKLP